MGGGSVALRRLEDRAMSKKQGLFSRLRQSISSTLNDAVESMSDPGQEIALMLDDLAAQIQNSEKDLKQAVVDRKVLERKLEEQQKKAIDWEKRAEQALKVGEETLARQALKQKAEVDMQVSATEQALAEQRLLVEQMQKQIKESTARLKSLNLRRGSLMAQARAAKKGIAPGQISDGGTGSRLSAIEDRIQQLEAMSEVQAELASEDVAAAELDAKFSELSEDSEVDDALEQLKAKLAASQKSLPKADGESDEP